MKSIANFVKKRLLPRRFSNSDWHRRAVGGLWDTIGKLQFDFLVSNGLMPYHYFLDIGCGSLRGGVHFIGYLNKGHYFGVDKNQELLDAGMKIELKRYGLENKNPILVQMANFNFQLLNTKFDFALAQSLFTHLPLNDIILCIMRIEKALVRSGRFYATFFENPKGKLNMEPVVHPHGVETYLNRDPFHYDFGTFEWICEETELKVEYIGDWGHPKDQKMIVFTKR